MLRKALNAFISTDQIDEHLKMTLQEDLNSMAPGIIIQVHIKRHSIKHGRRPTVIRRSEQRPWRPSHGVHPDSLFLARFHVEIYYSCNKSILSVSPSHPGQLWFLCNCWVFGGFMRHTRDFIGFLMLLFLWWNDAHYWFNTFVTLLTGRPRHKTTHPRKCSQELWTNVSSCLTCF